MSVLLIAGWLTLQCAPLETPTPYKLRFFGWPMILLMPYPIEDGFGDSILGTQWQYNGVVGNLLFLVSCLPAIFYLRRDFASRLCSLVNLLAMTGAVAFCVYYFGPGKDILSQTIKMTTGTQTLRTLQTDRPLWQLIICCTLMAVSVHGILRLLFDGVSRLQSKTTITKR